MTTQTFLAAVLVTLPLLADAATISVTSPATGAVVTTGFPLTADVSAFPATTQVRFYVDNRLECVANSLYLGQWSCPKMLYATYSDERAASIYAEAYNAAGALLASSSANTFRINNGGLNAVTTFADGNGPLLRGGTTSGTLTVTMGQNASVPNLSVLWNLDGATGDLPQSMFASNAAVNTTTGHFTVPVITGHTGTPVYVLCNFLDASGCTPNTQAPSPLVFPVLYHLIVYGPNDIGLADTLAHAQAGTAVAPLNTSGLPAGSYTQILHATQQWEGVVGSNPFTVDTTYFRDGRHRFEQLVVASGVPAPPAGTFTFASTAITISTGIAAATNFPLVQGQAVTVSSSVSLPPGWTGTMYAVVQDPNDFCLASSAANAAKGICIAPLTNAGSGTMTVSFNVPNTFWLPSSLGSYANRVYGTDINWFTTFNGAVPLALRTKFSKIVGISGDTFSLAPYVLNCDGSTTAISAGSAIYSTADPTRATVSSSGVVTLGSVTGHTLISVVDNVHLRETLVDVQVRGDRTTYKHFSKGFGIIPNYDPAKSVAALVPFGGELDILTHNPFPVKYLKPAFTAMSGGFQGVTITPAQASSWGATDYNSWYSVFWNASASNGYSFAAQSALHAAASGLLFYSMTNENCSGYNAYRIWQDAWRQQAISKMFNDLAPMTLGHEHCDEMTTRYGSLLKPRGEMGSGNDSLGNGTLGGQPAGLTQIVVSGCPAVPCIGTGTVYLRSWQDYWGFSKSVQISSATTHNLNGPYVMNGTTFGHDNPIGQYMITGQITTYDVPNGTYNSSTDPGLVITAPFEGVDYNTNFPSSTASVIPLGNSGFSSISCTSNVCTLSWTAAPLVDSQTVWLTGFTNTGLNGYWRFDQINANSGTVRVANVANGVYTNSTDPGSVAWPMGNLPQTFVTSMFSTYLSGAVPPLSGSLLGGNGGGLSDVASYYGPTSPTTYHMHNLTIISNFEDRYGPTNYSYRDFFQQNQLRPLVDGSLPINVTAVDKPVLYQSHMAGDYCDKIFLGSMDCKTDTPGADLIMSFPLTSGKTFVSNIMPWIMPNGVGSKPYQYMNGIGANRLPPAGPAVGYEASADEVDQYPDQWLAMVNANLAAQHEDRYLLQPLTSAPDLSNGPAPYTLVECQAHSTPSNGGNALLCVNLSEEVQGPIAIDLSGVNLGGPMRRWNLSGFGDTVTSLPPTTTVDTQTFQYGQAFLYVSQPIGAIDDLKTINVPLTPAYGASKAVLEIHYYPNDQVFQSVDCGIGVCPPIPVNLHNLDVYVRKRFTKADGTPVAVGDLERIPAQ